MRPFLWLQSSIYLLVLLYTNLQTLIAERINRTCRCGKTKLEERIIGGHASGMSEVPWQAYMMYQSKQRCGGSVINDRYVLTAGHCVYRLPTCQIGVLLGLYNRRIFVGTEKLFSVVEVKVHKDYLKFPMHALRDIALLKLNETIRFTDSIQPVCLPRKDTYIVNVMATITGWGVTGKGKPSNKLMKAQVYVLPPKCCLASRLGKYFKDDMYSMLCAYSCDKDACQGDSGGPMVYTRRTGVQYQIGIISWGDGCGLIDTPGGYTRVSAFWKWINNNTKDAIYCRR